MKLVILGGDPLTRMFAMQLRRMAPASTQVLLVENANPNPRLEGVQTINQKVIGVRQRGDSGAIEALRLADGTEIWGDLFVDCSGAAALLIEETRTAGFEPWRGNCVALGDAALAVDQREPARNFTVNSSAPFDLSARCFLPMQNSRPGLAPA